MLRYGTAGLLGLALSGPAIAGDIPGDVTTRAVLPASDKLTQGSIDGAPDAQGCVGDVDWYRVSLEKGQHYAFEVTGWYSRDSYRAVPRLYDSGGRLLKQGPDAGGEYFGGLEFTAPRTGLYYYGIQAGSCEEINTYFIRYNIDAPNDFTTRKVTRVGKSYRGNLLFPQDVDFLKVQLAANRTYRLTLTLADHEEEANWGFGGERLTLYAPNHAKVADAAAVWNRSDNSVTGTLTYRPKVSGTYFVAIGPGDFVDAHTYTLLVR
jgi:hypothetical protein